MSAENTVHEQVRAARREAYREAILTAARSLFETQGFRDITMADIAKAASVAKGTLYNYFESKEEVFAQLADRERAKFLVSLDAAMDGQTGWSLVQVALRQVLELIAQNTTFINIYIEATGGSHDSPADPGRSIGEQALTGRLSQCLEQLARDGKLRADLPLGFMTTSLVGLLDATIREWVISERPGDVADRADLIVRLFRNGAEA